MLLWTGQQTTHGCHSLLDAAWAFLPVLLKVRGDLHKASFKGCCSGPKPASWPSKLSRASGVLTTATAAAMPRRVANMIGLQSSRAGTIEKRIRKHGSSLVVGWISSSRSKIIGFCSKRRKLYLATGIGRSRRLSPSHMQSFYFNGQQAATLRQGLGRRAGCEGTRKEELRLRTLEPKSDGTGVTSPRANPSHFKPLQSSLKAEDILLSYANLSLALGSELCRS